MKTSAPRLLLLLGLYSTISQAQTIPPGVGWQRTYGGSGNEEFRAMELTNDGGFIAVGLTNSVDGDVSMNAGGDDYWIIKSDSVGNIQWQKVYGGSGTDWARSISKTSNGGYIVAGYSQSNNQDVSGNHGRYDFWILKLDSVGNIIWKKCFGGSEFDNAYRAIETSDGNYLVVGFTESSDGQVSGFHGGQDYWILKLDPDGNILWTKTMGGSGEDQASCVIETPDHNYLVAGYSESGDGDVTDHIGQQDMWVVKLSEAGDVIWKKSYGGTHDDGARWITSASDGGYVICGSSNSLNYDVTLNHGSYDYWIVKLDTNGSLVWQKSLGGSDFEYSYYIAQDKDQNYLVAGYSYSNNGDVSGAKGSEDYWLVKVDRLGNLLWQKTFGGSLGDECRVVMVKKNGSYLLAGFTNCTDGDVTFKHGSEDAWIVETCSSPEATITNGSVVNSCKGNSVTLNASTGTGYSYQWNKNGILISSATNSSYLYTSGITANFTVVVTIAGGCSSTSSVTSVNKFNKPSAAITPLGNLNICSVGQVVLQASSGTGYNYTWTKNNVKIKTATNQSYTATSIGNYKVKITDANGCKKTSTTTTVYSSCRLDRENMEWQISISPNPSDGNFVLHIISDQENGTANTVLLDLVGNAVMKKSVALIDGSATAAFEIPPAFANGIYFLRIETGETVKLLRLTVQR